MLELAPLSHFLLFHQLANLDELHQNSLQQAMQTFWTAKLWGGEAFTGRHAIRFIIHHSAPAIRAFVLNAIDPMMG